MRRLAIALSLSTSLAVLSGSASPSHAVIARAALGQSMPSIKLDSITLKDAIDFVQDVSGANVHVNWKALEMAGVAKDAMISMNLRSVPLRKALDLILSEAAGGNSTLTYTIDDNVIEITTREIADKTLITRVYPVDDLLMDVPDFEGPAIDLTSNNSGGNNSGGSDATGGGGSSGGSLFGSGSGSSTAQTKGPTRAERAQQLVDLITSIVRPEIWKANGGPASIRFFNNSLIITAPRSVHEALDGPTD